MTSKYPGVSAPRGQDETNLPNTARQAAPQHPVQGPNRVPLAGNQDADQPKGARHGSASIVTEKLPPMYGTQLYHSNNNSSHRPSAQFMQSQAFNILRNDSALPTHPHGANQHPSGQTINFYRGSHVTISGNAFQHRSTRGNQILESQEAAPPVDDEDRHTADARYEETFDGFISDDITDDYYEKTFGRSKTTQTDVSESPLMNVKVADDIQQFSHISDRINNGSNDFIAFNVEVDDGNDGQSVGCADVMDESAEGVEESRASISVAAKRRRSSGDNGDSSESINNSVDGLPKAQIPATQRKPAKRAKSNTPVESIENPVTMQSAAVQSTPRSHLTKAIAAERLSRRQSLAAADFTNVKVADGELKGMTFTEAQEMSMRRMSLQIEDLDDVAEVKAEPKKWIIAIMEAFDQPYSQTPKMPTFKQALVPEFQRWQKEHYAATMEHLEENKGKDLVEACATMLYHLVVDAHEKGAIVESAGKSFTHDVTSTCKQRLEKIIEVLTSLTIVRRDLVTGFRLNELVASPSFVMKRKEENKQENDKKKEHKKARTEAKAKLGKETESKDKQDSKRSGKKSTSEIVEDDEVAEEEASADAVVADDSVPARNDSHSSLESAPADNEMSESEQ